MTGRTVRVLVVDDQEIARTGLSSLLNDEPDFDVVGEAASIPAARALLDRLDVDVLVLDHLLEDTGGLELCRELTAAHARAAVVIHSIVHSEKAAQTCFAAGARAYVVKDASTAELKQAIRTVAAGTAYLDPKIPGSGIRRTTRGRKRGTEPLSPAVLRVLKLAIEGKTNAEIAAIAGVSTHTVKSQLSTAYSRLGVRDRAEAAAAAVRLKLF